MLHGEVAWQQWSEMPSPRIRIEVVGLDNLLPIGAMDTLTHAWDVAESAGIDACCQTRLFRISRCNALMSQPLDTNR